MICLYQLFGAPTLKPKDWGNCHICTPDEKNQQCKGYIGIAYLEVKIEYKKRKEESPQETGIYRLANRRREQSPLGAGEIPDDVA